MATTAKYILVTHFAFFAAGVGGSDASQKYYPPTDPLVQAKLNQWQNLKFGLLMHWGPYSQWGVVESWSICAEDEGWCRRKSDNYVAYKQAYENLKTTFNPVKFDPAKWADAAAYAGMRYVVFTTKHHDGFCMYDTRETDYKSTDSGCPFHLNSKANITREIFNAFRAQDFWVGAYFSKPDWHSPFFWWPNFATPDRNVNYNVKIYPERWEKFVEFTHRQIDELMSDYGKIDILWLDGGWVQPYSDAELLKFKIQPDFKQVNLQNQDIRMAEIAHKARAKQPGLIVVDRAVEGEFQDYLTPENVIPDSPVRVPWESNLISGGGYSYTFNAKYLTGAEVVRKLVDIVAKGGNLLLNIAPGPTGELDADAYQMLRETGDWMQTHHECIYDTRPIEPYRENRKLYFTESKNGDIRYAIYLPDADETNLPGEIFISSLKASAGMTVSLLGTNAQLTWQPVGSGFKIIIPEKTVQPPPNSVAWVFRIGAK